MKNIIIALAIATIALSSCSKKSTTGTFKIVNATNSDYQIFVDGVDKGNQSANSFSTVGSFEEGVHTLRVLQTSNIVTPPAIDNTSNLAILAGEESVFTINP